ncbi:MAG: sigma-B regulation protein RsbU (phosphoserine phosphatase), partial [Planctomycetota bacterium]
AVERPATVFLRGGTQEDKRNVQVLLEAIAAVSESRDLESLLDYVVDQSVDVAGAERGFLVLLDDAGEQVVRVGRHRGGLPIEGGTKYSTSVVQRVLDKEEPMRTTVQSDAEALELGASVFDLKLRAVMCVPLTPAQEEGQAQPRKIEQRGVLYVDSKAATREFKDEDLSLFFALAQHIAIALENARLNLQSLEKAKMERSLEIARDIQSDLMPQEPKTIPGIEVFGWYRPAEHASGDFYDFVPTRQGSLAVVLGDVTGHGIGPALITATAQASLRAYANVLEDPPTIINMLHKDLAERMDDGMFLTLFLGLFSSNGRLQVVNAGQTPPLLWRKSNGKIETIAGNGPALGMMDTFEYCAGPELHLEVGDLMVAFTDGLVEARHHSHPDRLFGDDGMRAVLADIAASGCSAQEAVEALVANVLEFSGAKAEDDMTVVAVRRLEP